MCVAYFTQVRPRSRSSRSDTDFQAIDKGALGPASIMGWQANVGAKGQDYALTSTFLYIGIIVGEPIVCFQLPCEIWRWRKCGTSDADHTGQPVCPEIPRGQDPGRVHDLLDCGESEVITKCHSHQLTRQLLFGLTFSLSIPPVFAIRCLLGFFESSFNPCLVSSEWPRISVTLVSVCADLLTHQSPCNGSRSRSSLKSSPSGRPCLRSPTLSRPSLATPFTS